MLLTRSALLCAFIPAILLPAAAQTTSTKSCPAPPAILASTQPNIFSEQQEQWLGDAMADMIEADYRPVQDPAENAYLDHIAKRLLAVLPPTSIQFRVILVDSPEVNGFSLAGGRIYLTRKLVANARSEDEVASVMAHEMGHILTHQFAYETTADFKRLLNVNSVSDKADIYAKFQRLIDARMKDKHPAKDGNSDEGQDEADVIAVYASAAAGYRPQAYSEFWDRMFFVDGKVGGPLSDFFGTTKPESKRLRSILKLINALPAGCGATQPTAGPDFQKWHALVVANQPVNFALDFKPISEIALDPPLRMDIEQLRFSRDGKYILAQDETSIFVLSRDPYQQLFRIDAENALPAQFSPDSKSIVFNTRGLHIEQWSIADQKLITSHELVSHTACMETRLAPDGRTLFCLSPRQDDQLVAIDLTAIDTQSGDTLLQKKGIIELDYDTFSDFVSAERRKPDLQLFTSSFSADGTKLLIGDRDYKIAVDLQNRTEIKIGGNLKNDITGDYTFLGNDQIIGNVVGGASRSGISVSETDIFSFPEGKKLKAVGFHVADMEATTDSNFFTTDSLDQYPVALADITVGKFVVSSQAPSLDVWNKWLVNENADGSLLLHKLADKTVPDQRLVLPLSPLSGRLFADSSTDGNLLALSDRTRGAVWDLRTGKQIFLSRGFTSARFAPDNSLFVEFPKFGKQERAIHHISFAPTMGGPMGYKENDDTGLYDGMLQEWKKSGRKSSELIVHNLTDNAVLWQRTFESTEPAHTYNLIPGQTIFSYPFKTDLAKERLKAVAALQTEAASVKNKDAGRVIQMIDDATGNILHETAIEVPLTYEGVSGVNILGDNLYLSSDDNRTMVYNLQTGAQLRQLFGYIIALDPASNRICTVNRRDEATVYDADGRQVATFRTGRPLLFARFRQSGNQLLILTADQKVLTMEIANSAPSAPPKQSLAQSN